MRFATYRTGNTRRLGVLVSEKLIDLGRAYYLLYSSAPPEVLVDLRKLIDSGSRGLVLAELVVSEVLKELKSSSKLAEILEREVVHDPERVVFEPPVPNPSKVLCMAVNYWSHARETGTEPPEVPYLFVKLSSTLVGHRAVVTVPRGARRADYEVELAVVLGRRGKYIGRSEAMDYVFGYTVFNDVSIRERQAPLPRSPRLGSRWLPGKNFDTSAPLGPVVVTKDEIPDPHNLRLGMRISGEVRQDGSTSDMVFKIPEIIEAVSDGLTVEPGDIIATGTPSGVGLGSGRYLKHGDVMEAWVEGIGVLVNPVHFEQ
ncbi:MAG: fumarylacetoacetate hydrolase family protein [Sulfolobales archaeon]|nr:fumarylacetoacetate hydrolase family protein [Sulfolobales archaeon]MCX8209208.1 fumarylacetoacetate hydrolase family protein [Sulfolobales archaeon]MDW8010175.1 fumarylacetoacetate hydrolase family protein [Sulfolobales archaeon]